MEAVCYAVAGPMAQWPFQSGSRRSFFLGPSNRPLRLLSTVGIGKYLSPALFSTTLYLVLTLLPLVLLIFWLVRVRFTNAYNGKPMPGGGEGHSLLT